MNELDIILLIFVALGCIYGYISGFISQLTFGAGIVLGLLQAVIFHDELSMRIEAATGWGALICTILSFVAIIVLTLIVFKIISVFINAVLKLIHLKFVDKILGSLFSTFVAMVLLVAVVESGHKLFPGVKIFGKTSQRASLFYKDVKGTVTVFLSEIKKDIDEKK